MDKRNNNSTVDSATRGPLPRVVVITGPTASGKTTLAIEVAEALGTEIISADSRQVYRGLNLITAMPTAEERARVRHHLIDFLDPADYYSAAMFEADALAIIRDAGKRGLSDIVVAGGSMMYVDALLNGLDLLPTISEPVRSRVRKLMDEHGHEGVLALLEIVDPDYFSIVDKANTKRVMHALEITLEAGVPYSSLRTGQTRQRDFEAVKFIIDRPREELFDRINRRVDKMVAEGMEDEARRWYPHRELNSLNTVGFKEWFACFDGLMDRETTIERIKKNTRVYAKKQLTWVKRDPAALRIDGADAFRSVMNALKH